MRTSTMLAAGALLAGLAVALGAFAAHAMKSRFEPELMQTFETGVRYQMYHALALLACGALAAQGRRTSTAAIAFALGIALFSGSLYALVLFDAKWLGLVTPFGGVAFLVGWLLLARGVLATAAPAS